MLPREVQRARLLFREGLQDSLLRISHHLGERTGCGSVDLHFTATVVHGTLCVPESLTQADIRELIEAIDDELVDAVGVSRESSSSMSTRGERLGSSATTISARTAMVRRGPMMARCRLNDSR